AGPPSIARPAVGRVFLLGDDGTVRELAIETPAIQDRAAAAQLEKQIAASPPQEREQPTQKPKDGAKLPPGTEERLQWGEPVSGLRAPLARPQALGEPAGEVCDFNLVVQNVSDAPIRFSTGSAGPKNPYLKVRKDGRISAAFTSSKPTPADFMLQPREVAV